MHTGTARTVLLVLLLAALTSTQPARAEPPQHTAVARHFVDIPAQPLDLALIQLAQQTGMQIFFDNAHISPANSPALRGHYTLDDALGTLLSGTDLGFERKRDQVFIVDTGTTAPPQLERVVVSAGGASGVLDSAPASVGVIHREQLKRGRYASVQDAVAHLAGVAVVGGLDGAGSGISIRGMESSQTLILVDGQRIDSSEANPRGGGGDLESNWTPPVHAIERIEVIRGPMSSLYGSDAVGGIVNVITRDATQRWIGDLEVSRFWQQQSAQGDSQQTDFYLSGPLVPEHASLQIWGQNKRREEDGQTGGFQEVDKQLLGSRVSITPLSQHRLQLELGYAIQRYQRDPTQSGAGNRSHYDYRRRNSTLQHSAHWLGGHTEIRYYREHTERQRPLRNNEPTTDVTHTVFDGKYTTARGSHFLTVGWQWLRTRSTKSDFKNLLDKDSRYGTRIIQQRALFAEDEFSLSPALTATLGLRLTDHEIYGEHWSPRSYLVWQASPGWHVKAGLGSGFKAPDIREIEKSTGSVQARGAVQAYGNPELEPETSRNAEVGVYFANRVVTASATLFYNRFENKIINTGSYPFYYADGRRVPSPLHDCQPDEPATADCPAWGTWLNLPGARIRGVELEASWHISADLSLTASTTALNSAIEGSALSVRAPNGERLPFEPGGLQGLDKQPLTATPERQAKLRINWQARDSLQVYLWSQYQSDITRVSFGQGNRVSRQPKSLTTIDLGASWQVSDQLQVKAVLYNLDDRSRFAPPQSQQAALYQFPEDGRRLWLSLTLNL